MAVLGTLGLSSCAVKPPSGPPTGRVGPIAARVYGRVVAVRALAFQGGTERAPGPVGNDLRGTILGAIGGATLAGAAGAAADAEFIVRQDDGRTISVVQSDALQVRPGQRVVLIRGGRARLAAADG